MVHIPAGLSTSRRFWVGTFSVVTLVTLVFFQNCASDIPQEYLTLASAQDNDGDGAPDIPAGQLYCKSNQIFYQGNCYDRYRACAFPNGVGQEEFTVAQGGYGLCQLKTCAANYHIEGGVCTPNVKSCTPPNGTGSGQQLWNGTTYGACVPTGCPVGFHIEASQCLADTRACTVTNGTGTQTWNGASYGVCQLTTCNTNYVKLNNQCFGPLNFIYRYYKTNSGYWDSLSPNDMSAQISGFVFEKLSFKVYQTPLGITTIPLYRCPAMQSVNGFSVVQYYYTHTTCTNAPTMSLVGYLAREQSIYSANTPVYYCIPTTPPAGSTIIRPLTTSVLSECGGAPNVILGYGFQ